jgi:hypothetical protein
MALGRRSGLLMGHGPGHRGTPATRTSYGLLYSVQIEHDYYNESGNRCPDFRVVPTPTCAALMQSLGLLLNDTGTGFTISYIQAQKQQLADWVARQDSPPYGNWAALSFALVCGNPGFVGFTDLPINTNAAVQNIYLSNRAAHVAGDVILLTRGAQVGPESFVTLTPNAFDLILQPDVVWLHVLAVSGEAVIRLKGPVLVKPGRPLTVSVDFTGHPEGYYRLQTLRDDHLIGLVPPVLNSIASPTPMCFINLFFTRPTAETSGVYAVELGVVTPVSFIVRFGARATRWTYYIIPQSAPGALTGLRVTGAAPGPPAQKIKFRSGPQLALPTGQMATPFTAETMLVLYQKSPYRMQLHGWREGQFGNNKVSMDHMPVAPASPVWPSLPRDAALPENRSEIYVYV